MNHQPICVSSNYTINVLGNTTILVAKRSCMLKCAAYNNLPAGVIVKRSLIASKAGTVSVVLLNITAKNIWIQQPSLVTDVYEVRLHP